MGDRGDVTVWTRAYAKVMLHAARYPHAAVCGVLLAAANGGAGRGVDVEDAIPLFHQCLHVSPMYEIALTQIEGAAAAADQVVAGYYVACENFHHASLDKCPELRVADKIAENYPNALLFIVNNRRLTQQLEHPALVVQQHHADGSWRPRHTNTVLFKNPDVLEVVSGLLQRGVQRDLVDFDNHLDDLTQDWSNRALHALINTMESH